MGITHKKDPVVGDNIEKQWKHLKEVPANVDKVHFEGIQRTKDDVLKKVATGLFEVHNFHDVVLKAHNIRQQLESLCAFSSIEIKLDTSHGPGATSEGLEVTFHVKEKGCFQVRGGKDFGSGGGMCTLLAVFPNVFGRGETVYAQCKDGRLNVGFSMLPMISLLGWTMPRINQNLFAYTTDFPYSRIKEEVRGLAIDMQFESFPQVQHTLMWEGVWRNICGFSQNTPFAIREEAGHSVKTSVKHILTVDQRDNPGLPSHGSYFNLNQEYAGLGGNVNFLKHEVQYQINKSILGDWVLQGTLMGGLVQGFGKDSAVHINDKFFLGGPLTFRGFETQGVSPHNGNNTGGAEAYWRGGLHLYVPLPFRPLKNLGSLDILDKACRTHFFVNTGNIGNFTLTQDYRHNASALFSQLRWSCGAGLVLSLGALVRLELNYCFPITNDPTDRIRGGLQFGCGVNIL